MTTPTLRDRIDGIILPGYLLFYAVRSYAAVLLETLIQRNRPFSEVRDEAFARFWNFISAPPPPDQPLLGSAALIPPLLATASGVVLEVGPGSGAQVQYFAPAAENITRIYGAEPCLPLHPTLLAAAAKTPGLSDKYTIIPCSGDRDSLIPGLAKAGLLNPSRKDRVIDGEDSDDDGLFNTILCIRVLCSVTDLSSTCQTLHRLLKRGGRLIVVEHEVNPVFSSSSSSSSSSSLSLSQSQSYTARQGSLVARLVQVLYTLMGWSYFVGNCHLQRDIEGALIAAGGGVVGGKGGKESGWEKIELKKSFGWAVLPYVSGVLVKRR